MKTKAWFVYLIYYCDFIAAWKLLEHSSKIGDFQSEFPVSSQRLLFPSHTVSIGNKVQWVLALNTLKAWSVLSSIWMFCLRWSFQSHIWVSDLHPTPHWRLVGELYDDCLHKAQQSVLGLSRGSVWAANLYRCFQTDDIIDSSKGFKNAESHPQLE